MHGEQILPKLAHFGCIAAISCHEGVFLPLGVLLGMRQGDILPGIRPPRLLGVRLEGASFKGRACVCPK